MRRTWTPALFVVAVAVAVTIAGCSTTGPFGRERLHLPVGPSYVGGRGMQLYPTSNTLVANVRDAMADVGIQSVAQHEDPGGLIILDGQTADNRRARVTVLVSGSNSTVSVKVGWTGDEPITRALLDRLSARQGTMPPAPFDQDGETAADADADKPRPRLSRDAVPDAVMLRDQIESGMMPQPH